MRIELAKRLDDAHRACVKIDSFVDGMAFSDYHKDEVVRLAIERLLEVVGEALGAALRIDPSLEERYPDMRRAVDLRNRIIHGYDDVSALAIWDIVHTNLPSLRDTLAGLLSDATEDNVSEG